MAKSSSGAGNWVTINGVHVLIGANGKITKGPAKFIGSTVNDLKGQKMTADKKAELKKKYGDKKTTTNPPKEGKSISATTHSSKGGAISTEDGKRSASPTVQRKATPRKSTPKKTGTKSNQSSASKDVSKLKTDEYGTAVNTTGKTIKVKYADGKEDTFYPGDTIYNAKSVSKYGKVSYESSGASKSATTKSTSESSGAKKSSSMKSNSGLTKAEKLAMDSGLDYTTDYSKMSKAQIEKGMDKLEKAMSMTDDIYTKTAFENVLFDAANALCSVNYSKPQTKKTPSAKAQAKPKSNPATVGSIPPIGTGGNNGRNWRGKGWIS